ncbi:Protein brambleberry [Anabarilius grahami]|uniref:Protein brambleberry n=1 Tax=Anabarilius grahami TaxID=495550 RepID=A0A3N0YQB8_ANAGA|nr:Protein brambleberry [Anabarilius grahami]
MWTTAFLSVAVVVCVVSSDRSLEDKGRVELLRVRELSQQPRYGACWSRALEKIQSSCKDFSDDVQSKIALSFTHCHLQRSGRSFPECPEGSDVKTCTKDMDPVAFNTYTEFFTHAHSICHYLQSERWQQRAENTIHRLTESSAGVAEQLASTQRMAEDLVVAQRSALKSQESILRNGEELKSTLQDSTQGLRDVFAEMRHSAQEQQVAFAEIFNRVAFLQSFIMSETHTFSSFFYNALGFGASFLLTSEKITFLVGLLRKTMVLVGCLVLLYFSLRYRNISRESLEILRELKETRSDLQQALQKAECLSASVDEWKRSRRKHGESKWEERDDSLVILHPSSVVSAALSTFSASHNTIHHETLGTSEALKRRQRSRSGSRSRTSSATVYSVLVDDNEVIAYWEFFISHLLGLVCGSLMAVSVAQSDLDRIHSPPADQGGSICLIHPLQHLQEEEEEDAVRTQEWLLVLHLDCFEDSPFISGPGI